MLSSRKAVANGLHTALKERKMEKEMIMKQCILLLLMIGFIGAGTAHANGGLQVFMNGYAVGIGNRQAVVLQHVNGQPVQVYKMILTLRVMNQNGGVQPEDLEIVNYISLDASGNAQQCQRWFRKVSTDERNAISRIHNKEKVTHFPFLQLAVADGAKRFQTDEGNSVFRGSAVQCWETEDFWP